MTTAIIAIIAVWLLMDCEWGRVLVSYSLLFALLAGLGIGGFYFFRWYFTTYPL